MRPTVIYADAILFKNLILNYLLLVVSARICALPIRRLRCLLGGVLGAVYALMAAFPQFSFLQLWPIKIAVGIVMSMAVFGGEKRFFRVTLIFFAVSAAFAGAVMAAENLTGRQYIGLEPRLLCLTFAVCYFVFSIIFRKSAKHHVSGTAMEAEVAYCGRTAALRGIFDTGNSLTDPMTGATVAVAYMDALLPLFPEDMREAIKLDPAEASTKLSGVHGAFRPLPYSAVGVRGLLLTFRPDSLTVNGKNVKNPRIALSPTPLTGDGGWEILM